jgi:membrane associated rhomboid family serine protease
MAWLFYYGYTVGKFAGTKRILIGLLTSGAGIAFLVISYMIFG